MAYNGYLLKIGGQTVPMNLIQAKTYKSTPAQMMDTDSWRDTLGDLHRTVAPHTKAKVEFNTVNGITNGELAVLNGIITSHVIGLNAERRISVEYYDQWTDSYKTGTFYVPDVTFTIDEIDERSGTIYYEETRYAFVEY